MLLLVLLGWTEEEANALIFGQEDDVIKVALFTREGVVYDIVIDVANNRMISCTCEDFQQSLWTCKHMFLVWNLPSKRNWIPLMFTIELYRLIECMVFHLSWKEYIRFFLAQRTVAARDTAPEAIETNQSDKDYAAERYPSLVNTFAE
jgi:hypothetical protein